MQAGDADVVSRCEKTYGTKLASTVTCGPGTPGAVQAADRLGSRTWVKPYMDGAGVANPPPVIHGASVSNGVKYSSNGPESIITRLMRWNFDR